jgi:hypothetical protein
VVAELFLKDQQEMLRRRQSKGSSLAAVGALPSIPESSEADSTQDTRKAPHLSKLSREATFSRSSTSVVAKPQLAASRSASLRRVGTTTTIMGGFAGGGLVAYVPEAKPVYFAFLCRSLRPVATALSTRLEKRPNADDLRRYIRVRRIVFVTVFTAINAHVYPCV